MAKKPKSNSRGTSSGARAASNRRPRYSRNPQDVNYVPF